jgi:hypothetical protein
MQHERTPPALCHADARRANSSALLVASLLFVAILANIAAVLR